MPQPFVILGADVKSIVERRIDCGDCLRGDAFGGSRCRLVASGLTCGDECEDGKPQASDRARHDVTL